MTDQERIEALEGRVDGLTRALSSVVQGLLLADADARRDLRGFLERTAHNLRVNGISTEPKGVVFTAHSLDVFDQLIALLDVMLPENLDA